MIAAIRLWWDGLSRRERWLVGLAGALAGGIFAWLLVYHPLLRSLAAADAAHAAAIDRQAAVASRIAALEATHTAAAGAAPATLVAQQLAAEAGLALTRNDPAGEGGTAIAVASARGPAALSLLRRLEDAGLVASEVTLRKNSDGSVALTARLQGRAR